MYHDMDKIGKYLFRQQVNQNADIIDEELYIVFEHADSHSRSKRTAIQEMDSGMVLQRYYYQQ